MLKRITRVPRPIIAVYQPEENVAMPELDYLQICHRASRISTSPFRQTTEHTYHHYHRLPDDSNLLSETFTIGVLDILGIYTDENNVHDGIQEGIAMGVYYCLFLHIDNHQHQWHNYKPLKRHISEVLMNRDNGWDVTVVYCTRNCADNIGSQAVISIMHCLFDDATIERI